MENIVATDVAAAAVLDRLHRQAKGDRWKIARGAPSILTGVLRGASLEASLKPLLKTAFIPVAPESGRFLFQTALARQARHIVEFGTSYGISTIYLASAARRSGGRVITTELEAEKCAQARVHLQDANLAAVVEIREGDALRTLAAVSPGVDFLLLDGWKDLYLPVLDLILPKLAPGAVVIADNIFTFRRGLRPYVERMQAPGSGFQSMTLSIGEGLEFSVRDLGQGQV